MKKGLCILGTEYEYEETTSRTDVRLIEKQGYCDNYDKRIAVEMDYEENHPDCIGNLHSLVNMVKRHEIIHAFFHESGLTEYAQNEQIVEWIALQFPNLLKAFEEVEAI